ncbi:hypothetical protein [Streptomyces sp. RFCAC02]|uniref:hypothetical protein n=1 Tax=Streptomyces sp. RFCAC02 TaxID=2499143 RepID=UPI001F0DB459|nr:hypothetical protein [Streptomyces sp. RFCAC02]
MTRTLGLNDVGGQHTWARKNGQPAPPDDGRVPLEIRVSDDPRPEGGPAYRTVAFPERRLPPGGVKEYRAGRKQGVRTFVLWADPHRTRVFAHVVTTSATKGGPATYEVLGEADEHLARIEREPAMRGGGIRTRWTVRPAGWPPVSGLKGRAFWWVVWWLISPIQLVIAVGSVVAGSGDVARMPRRTRWRAGERVVLDYRSGVGDGFLLEVAEGWDDRVTASLLALLDSHEGWMGNAWDDYNGKAPERRGFQPQ